MINIHTFLYILNNFKLNQLFFKFMVVKVMVSEVINFVRKAVICLFQNVILVKCSGIVSLNVYGII